jgi:hypothetical protein
MAHRLRFHGLATTSGELWTGNLAQMDTFWNSATGAKDTKTILVVMKDATPFADVKRKAVLIHGVHTVCVLINKIRYYAVGQGGYQLDGYQNQHLDNLALKFNMKSGGNNFVFNPDLWTRLLGWHRNTTVIFGADVGHPPIGSYQGVPSVAAVLASYDNQFQNYPGSMRLQYGGQEVSSYCVEIS